MFHVKRRPERRQREWDAESLYAYGLRLLSYRARAEREVRQRFQLRGAPPELVDAAIERLRGAGFVDDEAFARQWVDSRRRASPRGDRLLQHELAAKGVSQDIVETTLGDGDAASLARAAAVKKARSLATEPEPVFTRRLTDFLLRRGFAYDLAREVVAELVSERLVQDA